MLNIPIAALILCSVGLAVAFVALVRKWRAEERAAEAEAKKTERLEKLDEKAKRLEKFNAGTHTEDGKPRCKISPCTLEGEKPRPHFAHDELGFVAWVRRRFGAPPRLRVELIGGGLCAAHQALVIQRYAHRAAIHEERRADFLSAEVEELAEFEHTIFESVSADLAAKRSGSLPPPSSKVTQTQTLAVRKIGAS